MEQTLEQQIATLQKAISRKQNDCLLHSRLADCYYNACNRQEAEMSCLRAIAIQSNLVQTSESVQSLLKQLGYGETITDIYMNLGASYTQRSELQSAIAAYKRAIECDPENYRPYYRLGETLQQQGQREEAIRYYLKVIQLQPDVVGPYAQIEYGSLDDKQLDDVIQCYRQVIQTYPDELFPIMALGRMLTRQDQTEEAISCYHTASYKRLVAAYPEFAEHQEIAHQSKEPDFLIIGAGKSGTTSLFEYLTCHPQIIPPLWKEIHFFDQHFERGKEWYLAQFPPIPQSTGFITGEASPWYLYGFDTVERVAQFFPNIKLIVLLRNPANRALSQYHMHVRQGTEKRTMREAISSEMDILSKITDPTTVGKEYWSTERGYLLFGLYIYYLEKWMSCFPKRQLLILNAENLYRNSEDTMNQIYHFLDISDYTLEKYEQHNIGTYDVIDADVYSAIVDFFQPHNQKLEASLDTSLNWT